MWNDIIRWFTHPTYELQANGKTKRRAKRPKPDDFDKYQVDGAYRKYTYRGVEMTESEYDNVVADETALYEEAGISAMRNDLVETNPSKIFIFNQRELYLIPKHEVCVTPRIVEYNMLRWICLAAQHENIDVCVTNGFLDDYTNCFDNIELRIQDWNYVSIDDNVELFMGSDKVVMKGRLCPLHIWQLSGKEHVEPNKDDFFGNANLKSYSKGWFD